MEDYVMDNILDISRRVISTTGCMPSSMIEIRYNREFHALTIVTIDNLLIVCWNTRDPIHCTYVFDVADVVKMVKIFSERHGYVQRRIGWILNLSTPHIAKIMKENNIRKGDG
jgi:hypothetical protein